MEDNKKVDSKAANTSAKPEGPTVTFEYTIREMSDGEIKVLPITEGATEQDVYQHVEDMANNIHYQRQAVAIMPYVTKAAQEAARDAVRTVFEVLQASQTQNSGNAGK